ncbi:hypothetical protein G7081_05035 [Vagococcus coleopterorum]|uniref:PepSY domain-containing protein n=1 Tax=Vagococcus coleopterorum TaxID=2714946 RepID=A0A6G8AN32_9ENTE|nr:PepSY domain-containing protein [Vagococcus coleopterorum]QIL46478.1 hypothetical protein G7081_05035 [Vagococcus coleopterorum]
MKKLSLIVATFGMVGLLAACQKVSKEDVTRLFTQDLATYETTFHQANPEVKVSDIEIDFDGKAIKVAVKGQDAERDYETSMTYDGAKILKERSEKLDREDKQEAPEVLTNLKELATLTELESALKKEAVDIETIESMELGKELGQNIWEVQTKEGRQEFNYFFNAETAELIKKERD